MKKIILIGRSECGKTTLTQALKGKEITYHKTQYVNNFDVIIDTPGEYLQTHTLGHALALYTYEATWWDCCCRQQSRTPCIRPVLPVCATGTWWGL